jgi:hypothetical protein
MIPLWTLVPLILLALIVGLAIGIWWGYVKWGPKWFDTSEGINKRFMKAKF